MGKQGPCYHCGVTSTPLWRNGPPDKPVLCNACGSRWRTKGTLVNYTPLHSRAEPDEFEEYRVSKIKSSTPIKNKEAKWVKRKRNPENAPVVGAVNPDYNNQGYRKIIDEDMSNRSSSGSAISNSESCAQFGSADASDLTDPSQSVVFDTTVPSRKRTCVGRPKQSPVEKLTKDLYTILHEQSSYFSGSSEEELLFESNTPMVSVEIGHGSVLIRHPSAIARGEEESEASSLSFDHKQQQGSEAYSRLASENKCFKLPCPVIETIKKPSGQEMEQHVKRNKAQQEKLQFLGDHNSPLCYVDIKDILNYDEWVRHLTNDEQKQLLKYLPSVDTSGLPDSLKSLFGSSQLKENICSFQKLLGEGVFDRTLSGVRNEEYKALKKLALCNSTKSKWVEQYNLLKDVKTENSTGRPLVAATAAIVSCHSTTAKTSRDDQFHNYPGAKAIMKIPKRVTTKSNFEQNPRIEKDSSCLSPPSLFFQVPPDSTSSMLDSLHFPDENPDQDLLLDVPSNGFFPQAELLPSSSFGPQASTNSSSMYQNRLRK